MQNPNNALVAFFASGAGHHFRLRPGLNIIFGNRPTPGLFGVANFKDDVGAAVCGIAEWASTLGLGVSVNRIIGAKTFSHDQRKKLSSTNITNLRRSSYRELIQAMHCLYADVSDGRLAVMADLHLMEGGAAHGDDQVNAAGIDLLHRAAVASGVPVIVAVLLDDAATLSAHELANGSTRLPPGPAFSDAMRASGATYIRVGPDGRILGLPSRWEGAEPLEAPSRQRVADGGGTQGATINAEPAAADATRQADEDRRLTAHAKDRQSYDLNLMNPKPNKSHY